MYAIDNKQFNSGMLAQYLTGQLGRIGKASGLVILLLAKINWKSEPNDYGPRGTVNHLTVRKMAEALNCSQSTVHEHLALLREAGIIGSEPVTDRNGATRFCRFWFAGFVKWLGQQEPSPVAPPPSNPPGRGGAEKPETNHNTRNQKIIDLEQVKSVRFSFLESIISEARPKLASGDKADAQMVFERFRSYNLARGNSRIALAALRGFARSFTEFRSAPPKRASAISSAMPEPIKAQEHLDSPPFDAMKSKLRANDPALFDAWFSALIFERKDGELRVTAPSSFVRSYVSTHHAGLIREAAGQGVRVVFA